MIIALFRRPSAALHVLGSVGAALALVGCEPADDGPPARSPCAENPGACGYEEAICTDVGETFSCECPFGTSSPGIGRRCEDTNECQTEDRVELCGVATSGCSNFPGTYECTCPTNGWARQGQGLPCADLDECATADRATLCGIADATCTNKPGTFLCGCPEGYELPAGANGDGTGSKCFDIDECADDAFCDAICRNSAGSAECVSTIADESSPYWRYACPTADDRFIDNKTEFELDCRCGHTQIGRPDDESDPDFAALRRCDSVGQTGNYDIGTGPTPRKWRREQGASTGATRFNGGFLDADERIAYVGAQWSDNTATDGNPELTYYGAIIAVNVDWDSPSVGNRWLISGNTLDGARGAGPTLRAVQDIERGADGNLYTMSWESGHPAQIMRIDPATGDRTLIWRENGYLHNQPVVPNQCNNGSTVGVDGITAGSRASLQMVQTGQGLTIADNGDFFLGIQQSGPAKGPRGIVRISADGSTCTWVTRFAATNGNRYAAKSEADQGPDYGLPNGTGPLGGGPNNFASNPVNLFYRKDDAGEWLYALDGIGASGTGTRYYRVNVATGDREQLFSSIIGDSHSVWDPSREVLWTTGGFDTTRIVALDILGHDGAGPTELGGIRCLSTNSDWYKCMRGPGDVENQNRGGTLYDPLDGNLVIIHGVWGLVRVEVATGNTYVISR